ncbi:E3 ubiquitin-protein ligase listerin-like [Protopterus annectens]|uniref:E3 ubiquitin-protein ligase listerin-like n=1 Tax=Protopterus annectens TaxID=7888 RepID=UPI001CF9ECB8|nr:E3 ubiquitin-protein ligase listerin-like [Protopterus annectens]
MGGKNKQRTKGNLQPSSSSRAAELLARESGEVPGFIGFGACQNDLGYVPVVQGAEEIDSLVDAEFRLVLRKLYKRDATTKLKAMHEFAAMCKEREPEVIKGVIPYWSRIYCKISLHFEGLLPFDSLLAYYCISAFILSGDLNRFHIDQLIVMDLEQILQGLCADKNDIGVFGIPEGDGLPQPMDSVDRCNDAC